MSELCKWLHRQLEQLPLVKFPFRLEQLPENGYISSMKKGNLGTRRKYFTNSQNRYSQGRKFQKPYQGTLSSGRIKDEF
jgi:hypothetical protein